MIDPFRLRYLHSLKIKKNIYVYVARRSSLYDAPVEQKWSPLTQNLSACALVPSGISMIREIVDRKPKPDSPILEALGPVGRPTVLLGANNTLHDSPKGGRPTISRKSSSLGQKQASYSALKNQIFFFANFWPIFTSRICEIMSYRILRPHGNAGDSSASASGPPISTPESSESNPGAASSFEKTTDEVETSSSIKQVKRRKVPETVTRNACSHCKKARSKVRFPSV